MGPNTTPNTNQHIDFISKKILPPELILHIFSMLPPETLHKINTVAPLWHRLALDPILWEQKAEKIFPYLYNILRQTTLATLNGMKFYALCVTLAEEMKNSDIHNAEIETEQPAYQTAQFPVYRESGFFGRIKRRITARPRQLIRMHEEHFIPSIVSGIDCRYEGLNATINNSRLERILITDSRISAEHFKSICKNKLLTSFVDSTTRQNNTNYFTIMRNILRSQPYLQTFGFPIRYLHATTVMRDIAKQANIRAKKYYEQNGNAATPIVIYYLFAEKKDNYDPPIVKLTIDHTLNAIVENPPEDDNYARELEIASSISSNFVTSSIHLMLTDMVNHQNLRRIELRLLDIYQNNDDLNNFESFADGVTALNLRPIAPILCLKIDAPINDHIDVLFLLFQNKFFTKLEIIINSDNQETQNDIIDMISAVAKASINKNRSITNIIIADHPLPDLELLPINRKMHNELFAALAEKNEQTVIALLDSGVSPLAEQDGFSILHYAITLKLKNIINYYDDNFPNLHNKNNQVEISPTELYTLLDHIQLDSLSNIETYEEMQSNKDLSL